MNIQPKPFLEKSKLRHQSIGNERRLNWSKIKLEHGTPFPLTVEFADIDQAVYDWADKKLSISYDGKRLPTYKLYSNQRINEYSQTWQYLDDTGNLLMNFKTLTRDNNPQKGENQGGYFNIPGNRDYPMFMVPVLQENGLEAYDMYSMKQPFCVDFNYTLNIITNKYELINEMNMLIHNEFKSLQSYIAPNGHAMPMTLEDISDESEYSIDDRKYYSQTYKIRVKGYIIRQEDLTVTHLPSRLDIRFGESGSKKLYDKKANKHNKVKVVEEYVQCEDTEEYYKYYNKKYSFYLNFAECDREIEFTIDTDFVLEDIETTNVYDFVLKVNDEIMDFENEFSIYNGDVIKVNIEFDNEYEGALIILKGYDPNVIIEKVDNESALDDEVGEEIIDVN